MLPRGRRRGWRKRPEEEKGNYTTIMVSRDFKATIDFERRSKERISDTVDRVWNGNGLKIGELLRKLSDKEEELNHYKSEQSVKEVVI